MIAPTRQTTLLGDVALASANGLEIGPRNAPLVTKAQGRVRYVDYATTDIVRANAAQEGIDPAGVVDVDIIWGARPLRELIDTPADYIVASHVIEHVPDPIGWLAELHAALKPGGTLGLAVPDRRFTFDIQRRESTLADLIEAYVLGHRKPTIRQAFEAALLSTEVDAAAVWRGENVALPGRDKVRDRLPIVLQFARDLADSGRYIDAHCWIFTPASFLDLLERIAWLGLLPYTIDAFVPTAEGSVEFLVRLRAVGAERNEETLASIAAARDRLAASGSETLYRARHPVSTEPPNARVAALERLVAELSAERQRMEDTYRTSTSWRMTAPLRALARRIGGH